MIKTKLILARFSHDGRLLERREQESRSWVRHFFDLLYPMAAATDLPAINDIVPAARTLDGTPADNPSIYGPSPNLVVGSTPGNIQQVIVSGAQSQTWCTTTPQKGEDIGIVVGTGVTAAAPLDNKLETKILHGETAGTLLHGGTEIYGLAFVHPNGQFTIRRYFTNVLGGDIPVTEVGIYSPGMSTASATSCYLFCIAHDVFAAVHVLDTEILEVTYVVQITV